MREREKERARERERERERENIDESGSFKKGRKGRNAAVT
jgi:hypothetical protein